MVIRKEDDEETDEGRKERRKDERGGRAEAMDLTGSGQFFLPEVVN